MQNISINLNNRFLGIDLEETIHRGEHRIKLIFDYDPELIALVKMIPDRRWSETLRCWHIPYHRDSLSYLTGFFSQQGILAEEKSDFDEKPGHKVPVDMPPLPDYQEKKETDHFREIKKKPCFQLFKQVLEIKRMSPRTCEIYSRFFIEFLRDNQGKDIDTFSYRELYNYIQFKTSGLNSTQAKQCIAAIKFYYEKALGQPKMFFKLRQTTAVDLTTIHIPFYQFRDILAHVKSDTDKLLFFLFYFLNLPADRITSVEAGMTDELQDDIHVKNNAFIIEYLNVLIKNHIRTTSNRKYLFENNSGPFTSETLVNKIYYNLGKYKLKEIYQLQFRQYLDSTDLSEKTRSVYRGMFIKFLEHFDFRYPLFIRDNEIRYYLTFIKDRSTAYQDSLISSLRFFYENVYNRKIPHTHIIRPRRGIILPDIFSREELLAMIESEDNLKHKLVIAIGYSSGLRRSELQNLKVSDIDFRKNLVFVRSGKGKKDRYSIIDPLLKGYVDAYLEKFDPVDYFFEGDQKGMPFSVTSISNVLKDAAKACGIRRRVHMHMLRHSFGTHLLEDGYDVRYVQELMGHVTLNTTQRYTHIVNHALVHVKSPLGKLGLRRK